MVEGSQSTEELRLLLRALLCGRPEHCPGTAVSSLPSRSLTWEVRTGSANPFPAHVIGGPAPFSFLHYPLSLNSPQAISQSLHSSSSSF